MLTPLTTVIIAAAIILLFAVGLPILDSFERFSKTVSTRWSIAVVFLALGVGVVIDFEHLSENIRHLVLLGCLIMSILYVVIISIEKWFANKWIGSAGITLSKGDAKVHVGLGNDNTETRKSKNDHKSSEICVDTNNETYGDESLSDIHLEHEEDISETNLNP